MTIEDHQQWLVNFYQQRQWYQYSPFVHLNFLSEETGEMSRAIRALEIGRDRPSEHPRDCSGITSESQGGAGRCAGSDSRHQ